MRNLPRTELINRAKTASGYRDTSDPVLLQDRNLALNKLTDYQLRVIISQSKKAL